MASQASPSTANTDTILAAIASHGAELSKICTLVNDLKKSMEGRLDSIEARLSPLQKEHCEAEHHMDDIDDVLSAADSRITVLETTYKELTVVKALKLRLRTWKVALAGSTSGLSVLKRA